jgi:hypothetical protein
MKGKIRYYSIVEQDVEFPDRLVEIQAKGLNATNEEYEELEAAIEDMVDMVRWIDPDAGDMIGIYYGEGFHEALTEF